MEEYDNSEFCKKKRDEAIARGKNDINDDELRVILSEATQGPWHWVLHDYSTATLQGPAEEWDHVTCVSPCNACQKRAKERGEEWQWGRCTCPTEPNAKLMALAPALAEAYLAKPKYPIIIEPSIIQYDENVFVWLDETGNVGGAASDLMQVKNALKHYALNM